MKRKTQVKRVCLLILFLFNSAAAMVVAADKETSAAAARAVAISAPRPEYPYEARRRRLTGMGIAVMQVDARTGMVTSVTMAPSTGHTILDSAALRAFRRWRFKPGTVTRVRLPIAFAMPVTIDPGRWYPFSGIVRAVNVSAGTIAVKTRTGMDTIVITARTRLVKNGRRVPLGEVAAGDSVSGRATVRPPKFAAVAQSVTIKSASE